MIFAGDVEEEPVRKGALGLGVLVSLVALAFSGGGVTAAQGGKLRSSREDAAKPDGQASAQFALSLINSGVEAARSCDPASQAIVLLMAGDAVRTVDPKNALTYYASSFEAAASMERSNLRLALEPGLVNQVADLDLDEAVKLVEKMDTPEITANPDVDARVATAHRLVAKLLARQAADDTDRAVGLLDYLGDTGQYPYAAAGETVAFLHQKGEDWRAVDVFMKAIGYFREDNRFKDSPSGFVDLMEASEGKVPDSVLVSAIHLCIAAVKEAITSPSTTGTRPQEWRPGESENLVARLLTIARRLDPRPANELGELYLKVHKSIKEQTSSAGGRSGLLPINASGTKPDDHVDMEGGVNEGKRAWEEVSDLAAKDSAAALIRARTIQLPEYRSRALTTVASNLRSPEKATSVLYEAEVAAEQIDSPQGTSVEEWAKTTGKVEAMVDIAEGWERRGDVERASASLSKAFALALDLIQKQAALRPGAPSGFGASTYLLSRLTQVAASLDPTQAAKRAYSISDPRLRAYFLVSVATAILRKI
jgi:hypothetical protein